MHKTLHFQGGALAPLPKPAGSHECDAAPTDSFPVTEHHTHCTMATTKPHCNVTDAHMCVNNSTCRVITWSETASSSTPHCFITRLIS